MTLALPSDSHQDENGVLPVVKSGGDTISQVETHPREITEEKRQKKKTVLLATVF